MQIDRGALAELVEQVIQEHQMKEGLSSKKRALVVFEGPVSEDCFKHMIAQLFSQYALTFFVLKTGSSPQLSSHGRVIDGQHGVCDVRTMLLEFDNVILPQPSLTTISKLAHVVIDSPLIELVFAGLEAQKQISIGSICQTDTYRHLSPSLQQEISVLFNKVLTFGVNKWSYLPVEIQTKIQPNSKRRVMTLEDVVELAAGQKEFVWTQDMVLTPLASDYLSEKKIVIKRVSS